MHTSDRLCGRSCHQLPRLFFFLVSLNLWVFDAEVSHPFLREFCMRRDRLRASESEACPILGGVEKVANNLRVLAIVPPFPEPTDHRDHSGHDQRLNNVIVYPLKHHTPYLNEGKARLGGYGKLLAYKKNQGSQLYSFELKSQFRPQELSNKLQPAALVPSRNPLKHQNPTPDDVRLVV